jgi:hypothetical protein
VKESALITHQDISINIYQHLADEVKVEISKFFDLWHCRQQGEFLRGLCVIDAEIATDCQVLF